MRTAAASRTLTVRPDDVFHLLQRPVSTEIKGSEMKSDENNQRNKVLDFKEGCGAYARLNEQSKESR